jgi:radical SAM superfamily enzyme YgiQ (UPF0313 family)
VVLFISTYDLGRQPFGLASPAAWFRHAGLEARTRDLSRERLRDEEIRSAALVAFYLPMHTATRLALPVMDRVRLINPEARVAAYGLYAPLCESLLREHGVTDVLGPEAEADLVALARNEPRPSTAILPKLAFVVPDRRGLPGLAHYAALAMPDGTARIAGSTDATRGCKHRCRHCPIVPVYGGQFRVVPVEVVLADIDQQVSAGAEHITFGDPDFFNGPAHARRIVEALHARHRAVTYDVTIKVEHLLRHRELLPVLARTGCLFITSAVESIDDRVLARLEKRHTRADFIEAVKVCRDAGVAMTPTFVAFNPWTTLDGYRELLETVDALDLVDNVAPVQWGLRLLVTHGSPLLELEELRSRVGPFDARTLTYPWRHDDPRVDDLQGAVMRAIGITARRPRREVFAHVSTLAGRVRSHDPAVPPRATIPYLNEPWYC